MSKIEDWFEKDDVYDYLVENSVDEDDAERIEDELSDLIHDVIPDYNALVDVSEEHFKEVQEQLLRSMNDEDELFNALFKAAFPNLKIRFIELVLVVNKVQGGVESSMEIVVRYEPN